MTISLQYIFMSSLISEKETSGCLRKEKKNIFESISMAGARKMLFKPCHQAPLNAK